jgi:hypothetical protein
MLFFGQIRRELGSDQIHDLYTIAYRCIAVLQLAQKITSTSPGNYGYPSYDKPRSAYEPRYVLSCVGNLQECDVCVFEITTGV